ncbi:hypothetical protein DEU56DRAFT_884580 [Suillus clintonianus]|uniref:uncharacterized protein n=1 Tax=Suillus clintonianus TaxID=1904413 RepID=UPI001B86F7B2|nr:uncharacterized protein DEU56DRAFT_884580 [Suillus clintonianus]KAG2143033.1 hypothetical protein DEU56DRAFT_884580 [Suillus clintonianus]
MSGNQGLHSRPSRPIGSRPLQRRLHSSDLQKGFLVTSRSSSSKSQQPEALANTVTEDIDSWQEDVHARLSSTLQLTGFENGNISDPFIDQHDSETETWMGEPPVESPMYYTVDEQRSARSVASGISSPPLKKKSFSPTFTHAFKASSSSSNTQPPVTERSDSGNAPTRTPSKVRWEQLRQHVLAAPRPASPPPSARIAQSPSRPHTPKLSRFPRLGFRHVVEHAREAAVDESRRFADELLQICWSVRVPDTSRPNKNERDGTLGTVGSSLHLPFVSSTTLNSFATGSTMVQTQTTQKGLIIKRPPSTVSGGQNSSLIMTLHEIILRYASKNSIYLPHETLVLSTLLTPFLSSESNPNVDDDCWIAIEAFEAAVQTWQATSDDLTIERCIWCCDAASMPSVLRPRVLSVLTSLLFPRTGPIELQNAHTFLSLVQALVTTLLQIPEDREAAILRDIILQLRGGTCGSIAGFLASAEIDGSPVMLVGVSEPEVREALVVEALVRCFEYGPLTIKRKVLHELLQEFWSPLPVSASFSPMISAIRSRAVVTFAHAAALFCASVKSEHLDMQSVLHVLKSRVVPEMACLTGKRASDARASVSRLLIELLCLERVTHEMFGVICGLTVQLLETSEWKTSMEKMMQQFISEGEWLTIIRILTALFHLPDELRGQLFTFFIPCLQERIVADPPPLHHPELTGILDKASRTYPQVFFKPLFTCAASSKALTIGHQLGVIAAISLFLPDFWTRDTEMILVALMNEPAVVLQPGSQRKWAQARLGQMIILVELIARVKAVPRISKDFSHPDDSVIAPTQFFSRLEARLGVLLEAKERTALLPLSMRLLYSILFTEIRLLTRSIKRPTWLQSSIEWLLRSHVGAVVDDDGPLIVDEDVFSDVSQVLDRVKDIYTSTHDSLRVSYQHRSTMFLFSSAIDVSGDGTERRTILMDMLHERMVLLSSLPRSITRQALHLLVVISACLTPEDYLLVGPFLWARCFDWAEPRAVLSASFLVMQCAEKTPESVLELIRNDLRNEDSAMKITAIQRLNMLVNMRFQILSQPFLSDKNRRRPFKLARDPLPFVPTDIGSSLFVPAQEDDDNEDMPKELRRRLAEVGWLDEKRPTDQKREWVRTPLSLLPSNLQDRNAGATERLQSSPLLSPISSPTRPRSNSDVSDSHLSRRSSDPTSRGVKRRAVFVPALGTLFPQLVSLTLDSCIDVSCAARDSVMDLLRHEPALFIRPILDLIASNNEEAATTAVRGLLHLNHLLPPAMAHYTFNHLAGYLKFVAREVTSTGALRSFALAAALLSNLVTQVSEMSIREIRRAKMDLFLMPSGSLWFTTSFPSGPMFPKALSLSENTSEIPPSLISITMIRVAQNRLFLSMLKRNPQDVQVIRKTMEHIVLPSTDALSSARFLELPDFVPRQLFAKRDGPESILTPLSLMLSRSHLLLIAQIFRSMSSHLSDRSELTIFIDGLNRILLRHGDDIGIVSQSLIALMVASARFRRLFTSGGGYSLFMLSVMKVYTEQEHHQGIRQAIEYAVSRFYAFHQEAFVFQTLDVVVHALLEPNCDCSWLAKSVFRMLSSLNRNNPMAGPDASGIRNVNRLQEKESLMITTADETFIAAIRRVGSQDSQQLMISLPEEYETKSLNMDNLVRLLLTVIGHDPSIVRAQNFLSLLKLSTPALYNASISARTVLREGIDAVGTIILRAAAKSKLPESLTMQSVGGLTTEVSQEEAALVDKLHKKAKAPSDLTTMRTEYLGLALAFVKAGGQLPNTATEKIFDIARILLREASHTEDQVANFLCQYSKATLVERTPSPKEAISLLGDLAPIMSAYASVINFAGIYEAISHLASDNQLANNVSFSNLVVTQICRSGLESQTARSSEHKESSMVSLLATAISFQKADVIAEIEKQLPSHKFLSVVVFKLVLSLETSASAPSVGDHDTWLRGARTSAWLRLLSYAMAACEKPSRSQQSISSLERRKSDDKHRSGSSNKEQVLTLLAAIQIIKMIIVRAGDDLSASLPSIWTRLAALFRSLVSDGDARFALEPSEQSAPPSPIHSPHSSFSMASIDPFSAPESFLTPSVSFNSRRPSPLGKPRVIDYALWSLLELLFRYRTPLILQLKLLAQEKAALLDEQLRYVQSGSLHSSGYRPPSVFSKPRKRLSSIQSAVSPLFNSSPSTFFNTGQMSLRPPMLESTPRKAGFERSPTASPIGAQPRIIHLGPITPDLRRSASSNEDVRMLTMSTVVKTRSLVRATYHRVRLVQACMGYDLLLPLPAAFDGTGTMDDTIGLGGHLVEEGEKKWTMKQAVDALVNEMDDLELEFCEREAWREVLDESMVVLESDVNDSSISMAN